MGKEGIETIEKEMDYELIKLNGKEFKVGKQGVIRKFKIARLLGNLMIPLVKIFTNTQGGKTNLDDIAILLGELDISKIEEILSVALNTKDGEIIDSIDDDKFVEIILAVVKHNDFAGISKKANRVVEAINEKTQTS